MTLRRLAGVVMGVLAALAGPAAADDFCIEWRDGTVAQVIVGEGFELPGDGRCTPFTGFQDGNASRYEIAGNACRSGDGARVRFALMATPRDAKPLFLHIDLPVPLGPDGGIEASGLAGAIRPRPVPCPTAIASVR
jgi:hypothetical protein